MTPIGWFAAGMGAAFLGQWMKMLMLSQFRRRVSNSNSGPNTAKSPIKPHFPPPRIIREDFLP